MESLQQLAARRKAWVGNNRKRSEQDWNHANRDELVRALAEEQGDKQFLQALDKATDYMLVNDALGSHYVLDTFESPNQRGQVYLAERRNFAGNAKNQNIVNGLLMALDSGLYGPIVERMERSNIPLRQAMGNVVSDGAISELAGVGLRNGELAKLSPEQKLLRAGDRGIDLDRGYDEIIGSPYADVRLDGGHELHHDIYPEYSSSRWNMGFENQHVNKVKGKREGQEELQSYINSILNRLKKDESDPKYVSPLMLANAYEMRGQPSPSLSVGRDLANTGDIAAKRDVEASPVTNVIHVNNGGQVVIDEMVKKNGKNGHHKNGNGQSVHL